jgi:D-glycero-D-manno-heptose 1,7-bisphosphate phosphatase
MKISTYKNILLDRDGIINEVVMRDGVVSSPRSYKEFLFRDDFLEFSKKVSASFNFYLITNQPDISRGLLKKNDLKKMHDDLQKTLPFKEMYVCQHDNYHNCTCRKPKPGMILQAINKNNLLFEDCIMIGDSLKDVEAANAAGIDVILLNTAYNKHIISKNRINSLTSLI